MAHTSFAAQPQLQILVHGFDLHPKSYLNRKANLRQFLRDFPKFLLQISIM